MKSRIFIILNDSYPVGMASAKRTATYVKGFTELGYETKVIVPIPKEVYGMTPKNTSSSGVFNGGTFRFISNKTVRSRYFVKRRIDDVWGYLLTLFFIISNVKSSDKIIVYGGGWIWYVAVCLTAKLKNVKVFLELNEYPYFGTQNIIQKIFRQLTFILSFPLFNGFIAISEALKVVASKYKSKNAQIIKVPIVVIPAEFHFESPKAGVPYVFHAGTLNQHKDGVVDMIKSFALASNEISEDIKFYLAGVFDNKNEKSSVEAILNEYSLNERVIFTGYLNQEEIKKYMSGALLSIIAKSNTLQNKYGFPTKLGEYLAAGIPVIITNVGESMYYLKNNFNACIVEPDNPDLIAHEIVHLLSNEHDRKQLSINGKQLAQEEFNYLYQMERIINFM
jgi:glycosyltransferase involved in cell wall biosynthesis